MPATPVVGWRSLAYYDPPPAGAASPSWWGITRAWCSARWRRTVGATRTASTCAHRTGQGRAWCGFPRSATRSEEVGAPEGGSERRRLRRPLGRSRGRHTSSCAKASKRQRPSPWLDRPRSRPARWRWPRLCRLAGMQVIRALAGDPHDHDRGRPGRRRPPDDRGYNAGERAARAFALAHHKRVEIKIALPGQPARTSTGSISYAATESRPSARGSMAHRGSPRHSRRSKTPGGVPRAPPSSPRSSAPTRCRSWRA